MAAMSLKATQRKAKFELYASGLDSSTHYFLSLNGHVIEKVMPNDDGTLVMKTELMKAMDILDLRTLAIWDHSSNTVLSTTLVPCP